MRSTERVRCGRDLGTEHRPAWVLALWARLVNRDYNVTDIRVQHGRWLVVCATEEPLGWLSVQGYDLSELLQEVA